MNIEVGGHKVSLANIGALSEGSTSHFCVLCAVLGSYDDVTPRQFFNVQVGFRES